jgi:poly(A) polymerase Pap1
MNTTYPWRVRMGTNISTNRRVLHRFRVFFIGLAFNLVIARFIGLYPDAWSAYFWYILFVAVCAGAWLEPVVNWMDKHGAWEELVNERKEQ